MKKPDVRFWFHWRGKPLYVELTEENDYRYYDSYSNPTDEGYSGESIDFILTCGGKENQWIVGQTHETGGRDCDGEISHTYTSWAKLDELAHPEHPMPMYYENDNWVWSDTIFRPKWNDSDCRVYDQYAQMAGY